MEVEEEKKGGEEEEEEAELESAVWKKQTEDKVMVVMT